MLFRSAISDEDGGNPANIAASEASNQTERDARAAKQSASGSHIRLERKPIGGRDQRFEDAGL
jgi:hypothetical protein